MGCQDTNWRKLLQRHLIIAYFTSKGKGLGDKFLRHIERTKAIVHLIDINSEHLKQDYETIRKELDAWSANLLQKKEIVVLNKADTMEQKSAQKIKEIFENEISSAKGRSPSGRKNVLFCSAVSGQGVDELLNQLTT